MKKIIVVGVLVVVFCALTGCAGAGAGYSASKKTNPKQAHKTNATSESDVVPTYPKPTPQVVGEPREAKALVGEWECKTYINSKLVIPSIKYVRDDHTASASKRIYKIFDDGKSMTVFVGEDGTESYHNGEWSYENGTLFMSENFNDPNIPVMRIKVLWYQDDLIEFRYDLPSYEKLISKSGVENVKVWYEPDGSLRTHMDVVSKGVHSTMMMIESPCRLKRIGDVE